MICGESSIKKKFFSFFASLYRVLLAYVTWQCLWFSEKNLASLPICSSTGAVRYCSLTKANGIECSFPRIPTYLQDKDTLAAELSHPNLKKSWSVSWTRRNKFLSYMLSHFQKAYDPKIFCTFYAKPAVFLASKSFDVFQKFIAHINSRQFGTQEWDVVHIWEK